MRRFFFGEDQARFELEGVTLLLRTYEPDEEKRVHAHDGATLFMPLRGQLSERCGNEEYQIPPFAFALQARHVEHSSKIEGRGMRALFIEIPDSWLEARQLTPPKNAYRVIHGPSSLHAVRLVALLAEGQPDSLAVEERLMFLFQAAPGANRSPQWIQHVDDLIRERYCEPLSLAGIARCVGVHPVYLARAFRKCHGRSVSEYLRAVRVTAALAKADEMPLGQAATECGFSDQSHFCRSVRMELGRSPRGLRRLLCP